MAEITFVAESLTGSDGHEAQMADLEAILGALTLVNWRFLSEHPGVPKLAESGIRLEALATKRPWRDVPAVLAASGRVAMSRPEAVAWRAAEVILERGASAIAHLADPSLLPLGGARAPVVVSSLDDEGNRRISDQDLDTLLSALMLIDAGYLIRHPEIPNLYESGVRYKEEPPGQEDWLDIPSARRAFARGGSVDCEDIACWRSAELNVRFGMAARPTFACQPLVSGAMLYHIQVLYPNGLVEDPCRKLGMK